MPWAIVNNAQQRDRPIDISNIWPCKAVTTRFIGYVTCVAILVQFSTTENK